jgi:mannose-1-phosphate guanylyltransferase
MATALIMAGGFGKRLWPESTLSHPKQFISAVGSRSLLQASFERCARWFGVDNTFIITRRALTETVHQCLPTLPIDHIIQEPVSRDTAACIGYAALYIRRLKGDEPIHVLPSDHLIEGEEEFNKVMHAASKAAEKGYLATIGIRPTRAETGYGYLQVGQQLHDFGEVSCNKLERFTEKPSHKKAKAFVEAGNFLWNAGIFAWRPSTILEEIRLHIPALFEGLEKIGCSLGSKEEHSVVNNVYPQLPRTSIDYAVMEKTKRAVVIPAGFIWDDIGDWQALERIYERDDSRNITQGLVRTMEATNCTLVNREQKPLAALGVSNIIVVTTKAGVLVASKEYASKVKELVDQLLKDKETQKYIE